MSLPFSLPSYLPRSVVVSLMLFGLSACSVSTNLFTTSEVVSGESISASDAVQPFSLELYLNRSSMAGGEFENYKLVDGELFIECGRYIRGRHLPSFDNFVTVNDSTLSKLQAAMFDIHAAVEKGTTYSEPGTSATLFDPGQAKLSATWPNSSGGANVVDIKTSLDAIASPVSQIEKKAGQAALMLRNLPESPLCGNVAFYGLGRKLD